MVENSMLFSEQKTRPSMETDGSLPQMSFENVLMLC